MFTWQMRKEDATLKGGFESVKEKVYFVEALGRIADFFASENMDRMAFSYWAWLMIKGTMLLSSSSSSSSFH